MSGCVQFQLILFMSNNLAQRKIGQNELYENTLQLHATFCRLWLVTFKGVVHMNWHLKLGY